MKILDISNSIKINANSTKKKYKNFKTKFQKKYILQVISNPVEKLLKIFMKIVTITKQMKY